MGISSVFSKVMSDTAEHYNITKCLMLPISLLLFFLVREVSVLLLDGAFFFRYNKGVWGLLENRAGSIWCGSWLVVLCQRRKSRKPLCAFTHTTSSSIKIFNFSKVRTVNELLMIDVNLLAMHSINTDAELMYWNAIFLFPWAFSRRQSQHPGTNWAMKACWN